MSIRRANNQSSNTIRIPVRYVLVCDYPGLWFRSFIDAARFGYSYINEHASFMRCLEDVVSRILEEQVRKEISYMSFSEEDVEPAGRFDYYKVEEEVNSNVPYNENVEAQLVAIDKDENIIETKTIKIMDYLDNDPDYFREYGVSDAVYQYISVALKRFEEEARWHFALKKDNNFIEDVKQWPSSLKGGFWIDRYGTVWWPYIWFGIDGQEPDKLWSLHRDMTEEDLEFWFTEDPLDYIIENDEGVYSFFRGNASKENIDRPNLDAVRESCPIVIEDYDTPEDIAGKICAFLEKYQEEHAYTH